MRLRRIAAIALVILGAVACAPGPRAAVEFDDAGVRDSVRVFLAEFERFGRTGRLDSLGRLYSADTAFRFYESGALQYPTADSVRAALGALPPGTSLRTTFSETVITVLGPGVAMVGTRFTTAFGDGLAPTFSFSGAMTLVLRHEPAGWRIVSGHSSVPVPRGT
jgi:hypothetical protein